MPEPSPFQSFRMAGFESADHQNAFGHRVNFYHLTGHLDRLTEDYLYAQSIGATCVRESIVWSEVETCAYQYSWHTVEKILRTASAMGMQIVWDLCHFGYPDDLTPLHPMFARRFSHLAAEFVRFVRPWYQDKPLVITPINEVSFVSWLGGDARGTSPYCVGQGWEVKYHLMKAYIEGIERMKEVMPEVRLLTTEPLISVIPDLNSDESTRQAARQSHQDQFQVLDILSGRQCPELRGKAEYLDLIGVNFYYNNQWRFPSREIIPWGEEPPHPDWRPLPSLIQEVYQRYGRPIVITETSHPGEHRPDWFRMIGNKCHQILQQEIPLLGCCIYPFVDRPDWDFPDHWHHSGLWDIWNPKSLERTEAYPATLAVRDYLP